MISQGQQRAINALGIKGAILVVPKNKVEGGPRVIAGERKTSIQKRTFNSLLESGIIHKSPDGKDFYILTSKGEDRIQGPRCYGTPYRRSK